ncbi:MAG: hypothetical protein JWO94_3509 [Verrucomicrobiaceae bacterium]|nr:hypothetical protein [Verrucomicrobiaceae bacterium]
MSSHAAFKINFKISSNTLWKGSGTRCEGLAQRTVCRVGAISGAPGTFSFVQAAAVGGLRSHKVMQGHHPQKMPMIITQDGHACL